MGRGRVQIVLSEDESRELRLWAAGQKIERRLAQRAEVVLGAAEGRSVAWASAASGLSPAGVLEMAPALRVWAARGFARPAARGPAADDRAGDPPGGHRARHRGAAWGPHALDPAAARPGRRD